MPSEGVNLPSEISSCATWERSVEDQTHPADVAPVYTIIRMKKYIAVGALIGLVLGFVIPVVFPIIAVREFFFVVSLDRKLGYNPFDFNLKGGSVFIPGKLIQMFLGFLGTLCGLLLFKLVHPKQKGG